MKLGIKGSCVQDLKNRLVELRYLFGEVNNVFDEETELQSKLIRRPADWKPPES